MPAVDTALPLPLNLAIAASLATAASLICANFVRHLPRKHAILVVGLLTCLLAPLAVGLGAKTPLGMLPGLTDLETDSYDKLESSGANPALTSDGVKSSVPFSNADVGAFSEPPQELPYDQSMTARNAAEASRILDSELPNITIIGIFLLVCWVVGSVFVAALRLRDMIRVRRLLAACFDNQESMIIRAYQSACQLLEVRCVPRLLISQQVTSPIVFGFAKPRVILPAELQETFNEKQIAAMLMHELAHVSRGDQWVVVLQMITTTIYWWNPLVWISSRRIAETRELICDDLVLNAKASPRDYAWSLVTMAERFLTIEKNMAAIGISQASGGELAGRIRRLLARRDGNVPTRLSTRSLLGCLAFGTSLMFAMLFAQIPPLHSVSATGFPNDQQTDTENSVTKAREGSNFPEQRIAGIVVDALGNAVAGARVELKTRPSTQKVTDASGRFDFTTRLADRHLEAVYILASGPEGETQAFFRLNPLAADFQVNQLRIQLEETRLAEVQVFDAEDNPIKGANVAFSFRLPVMLDNLSTDKSGRVAIRIPASEKITAVAAWKDHEGLGYRLYALTKAQQADRKASLPLFPEAAPERLVLTGASPVTIKVVDDHDQPISGLIVYPWVLRKAGEPDFLNLSTTSELFRSVTDDGGIATFDWMPTWQRDNVTFWQDSREQEYERVRLTYNPVTDDSQIELRMQRTVPIRGRVADATGNPVEGIQISASGVDYSRDEFFMFVATDENGEYEIKAATNKLYLLSVVDNKWGAEARTGFAVYPDQPVANVDFQLREATKLSGRVMDATTGKPVANRIVTVIQKGSMLDQLPDVKIPNPESFQRMSVQPTIPRWVETNSEGEYEFRLGDGSYRIIPPENGWGRDIEIAGESSIEIPLRTRL